jgi:hypothetical protein
MRSEMINDYYEIFEDGTIISYCHDVPKVLKHHFNKSGYYVVEIHSVQKKVHRLLALAFVDGYFEGADVNHKNGIKTDNSLNNLEWVSRSENVKHAYDNNLCPRNKGKRVDSKIVIKMDKNFNELERFNSLTEAARSIVPENLPRGVAYIYRVCTSLEYGSIRTCFGFHWKYAE